MKLSTYLINLDSSTARLEKADAELKRHNIAYQRISAVDGRVFDVAQFEGYNSAKSNAYTGRDLIGSELGCYLSHKKALEAFVASTSEFGLILEDDLHLVDDFKSILDQTLNWMETHPAHWHVMNIAANKKKMASPILSIQGHQLYKAYYFPILALGLIWSRQGAESFLAQMGDIYTPIDVEIQAWVSKSGKGLSIFPPIVVPSGAASDIDAHTIAKQQDSLRVDRFGPRQKRMWKNKLNAFKNLCLKT